MNLNATPFSAAIATGAAFGASLVWALHLPPGLNLILAGVCMGANLALCALNIGLVIKNWGKA